MVGEAFTEVDDNVRGSRWICGSVKTVGPSPSATEPHPPLLPVPVLGAPGCCTLLPRALGGCVPAKRGRGGLRLTKRDLEVLGFVARHGFATAGQVGTACFSTWWDGRRELKVST